MNKQTLRNIIIGGLFLVPFIPFFVSSSFFFPYVTTKAFLWRLTVEVIFAAWLILAVMVPTYRPKKTTLLYTVLAWLAVVGVANLFGVAPLKSFWSNFERMDGFVGLLHLGAYFLVAGSVMTVELWNKWWKTELAASFLMCCSGLFQIFGIFNIAQGGVRVDGTFGNAAYLAVYMLFNIFIATLFLMREKQGSRARWLYGGLVAFQILILYYTATRGAILGLLGGALVFAVLNLWNKEDKRVRKGSLVVMATLAVVVGGFFLARHTSFVQESPVLSRFATLSPAELKTQGRYFVWPMAWQGFLERPLFGWGQENFSYVFQKHYSAQMYALEPWFDRAHNIFLDWLVAGGALGLLAYLGLYASALYLLWRESGLSFVERSILTALLAAYSFNNFFVFDQLTSYVLFFSLLAYIHTRVKGELVGGARELALVSRNVVIGIVSILLLASLYIVEWKPIRANMSLLSALQSMAQKEYAPAAESFTQAYDLSNLGRVETMEQSVNNVAAILQSNMAIEQKNAFYNFLKDAITTEGVQSGDNARYELLAGQFFSLVGGLEEGFAHLNKALELMPEKQQVYFELGSAYISDKQYGKALATFKQAYELAPAYGEARIIYLIGAIYAGDRGVESAMLNLISAENVATDPRVISAYYANGRIDRVRALLEARKKMDPANAATYDEYLKQL